MKALVCDYGRAAPGDWLPPASAFTDRRITSHCSHWESVVRAIGRSGRLVMLEVGREPGVHAAAAVDSACAGSGARMTLTVGPMRPWWARDWRFSMTSSVSS